MSHDVFHKKKTVKNSIANAGKLDSGFLKEAD